MKSGIKKKGLLQDFSMVKKLEVSKKENVENILFFSALLISLPIITALVLLFFELK